MPLPAPIEVTRECSYWSHSTKKYQLSPWYALHMVLWHGYVVVTINQSVISHLERADLCSSD